MSSSSKKKTMRVLRRPFEWIGIGLGLAIFPQLPRKLLLTLCDFISAVVYLFDTKGRNRSLYNLRIITGKYDPARSHRLAHDTPATRTEKLIIRRSYRNMSRAVGHAFWTCRNARKRVEISGELSDEAKQFLAENNPAVTVSGHIGCWEILSQLAFMAGHNMMSVAKDIGTGGMTKLLMKARKSIGQEIVPADGAFRPLMQGLKSGKSLGLLVDQVVSPKDGGIWVRFFGRVMPVSAAPAFFSAKGKAPIVVAWSRPLKDGRYRCEIISTHTPDDARNVWKMTQQCIKDLEKVIRRHPDCWVLNYNYARKLPTPADIAQLEEREAGK